MKLLLYVPQVIREAGESVDSFCSRLYYDFGFKNLKLAYNYTKDGEIKYTKHISYETLTFLNWNDIIPEMFDTKEKFISKAQHRTIGDCELLVDIDTPLVGSVRFASIEAKAHWAYTQLKREGYKPVMYASGGKGRHISAIIPALREYSPSERKTFKLRLLQRLGGELLKASEGALISLEGAPHRKTGKTKELVRR